MKLVKLELSGFKSFADTVKLDFEPGVTAIVGPNGCGKSNVSDAVRWVLGEQSARLLRGGKMEDVIFQGSVNRKPTNVTEVSLYLDNTDGDLPIAYREVVITRRLSRSGQSDYLLNNVVVRLRDIQDLLRGTGLGSDAGVVIEAEMIKLLLSDRADERRSLFEEAAGITLYRDRKHSSERRLDETQQDLQRVEDLIAEVQSQLRSLARQKGRAERHVKLSEEKFALQLTLARQQLQRLATEVEGMSARYEELGAVLPERRQSLAAAEQRRETAGRTRTGAEGERTEVATRLASVRVELGRLEGDLALAEERLTNAGNRRLRAPRRPCVSSRPPPWNGATPTPSTRASRPSSRRAPKARRRCAAASWSSATRCGRWSRRRRPTCRPPRRSRASAMRWSTSSPGCASARSRRRRTATSCGASAPKRKVVARHWPSRQTSRCSPRARP